VITIEGVVVPNEDGRGRRLNPLGVRSLEPPLLLLRKDSVAFKVIIVTKVMYRQTTERKQQYRRDTTRTEGIEET